MLAEMFRRIAEKSKLLAEDTIAMAHNEEYEDPSSKPASRKSLERITVLRKDTEELEEAEKEDPRIQFINDQLTDIFKGD
ncbi:MAG: hypothetical protein WC119_01815 [Synergistaceae bacterium]